MNDKTKSRPRKERWKGRKHNEKIVLIRRNVRHSLCVNKLRCSAAICRLVATAVSRNLCNSVNCWLANQESAKMEGMR